MTDPELSSLEELTLLLLYAPSSPEGRPEAIPGKTHLAKELFLLWKGGTFRESFRGVRFEPYRFGPWSDAIDSALDELASRDALKVRPSGKAQIISLTNNGERLAVALWKASSPEARAVLTDTKANLNTLSTDNLLSRIYAAYPEFAAASEWKGPRSRG
jgi:hypothetical protein